MRTQRIKTGLHRIGIAGAPLFLIGAIVAFIQEANGASGCLRGVWQVAVFYGGLFYAASRVLGWIASGFARWSARLSI
jgi:hypothetical protein